ncbi:MAG: hypothetical protein A2167_04390 [Planctomycetes bacterium RBG_13_46_10]|nr:MAG: hypothetical protein A2167_04390 [Planctomycetes bacterium RBG_13_46_10]
MKLIRHQLTITQLIVILLLVPFLSFGFNGCAQPAENDMTFAVIPIGSRDVAVLSPDDVVRLMRRAGFSDDQVVELGTQIRNAILQSGAVEVKRGKVIEAIFAVNGKNLFITTRLRGNFIYNVENGTWIGLESMQSTP